MDNISLPDQIKHLYKKSGYLERYGIEFYITLFIILLIIGYTLYYHVQGKKKIIKANWLEERCKPEIIPFAGYIQGGTDEEQAAKTLSNFTGCINAIFTDMAHGLVQGLEYSVDTMGDSFGIASEGMSELRALLATVRAFLDKIFGQFAAIFINLFTVIQKLLAVLQDTFGKATGVLTVGLFAFMDYISLLQAFLGAIVYFVLVISIVYPLFLIISNAITIIGFCAGPQGITPPCIIATAIASVLLAVAIGIYIYYETIFADLLSRLEAGLVTAPPPLPKPPGLETFTNLFTSTKKDKTGNIPLMSQFGSFFKKKNREKFINHVLTTYMEYHKKNRKYTKGGKVNRKNGEKKEKKGKRKKKNLDACFDKNTIICLKNQKKKIIQNIEVGDILFDGSTVTAWMELSTYGQSVYNCQGTLVTGNHRIYDEEKGLTEVKNHLDSFLVDDYRHDKIYCINTDSKQIYINGLVFTDWDDLDDMDFIDLKINCSKSLPEDFKKTDIHKYLDGGFIKDTLIELESGNSTFIKDIQVNDILRFGERVVGIVEINARDLDNINEYYLGEEIIKGSANLPIIDEELDISNLNELEGTLLTKKRNKLYHLLTDRGCFIVNGIRFGDYNTCLENYIDNDNFDFLSVLL